MYIHLDITDKHTDLGVYYKEKKKKKTAYTRVYLANLLYSYRGTKKQICGDLVYHLPFAWAQFWGARSLFGSSDVSDSQCSQGVFLLPFVCQGGGTEVKD